MYVEYSAKGQNKSMYVIDNKCVDRGNPGGGAGGLFKVPFVPTSSTGRGGRRKVFDLFFFCR